MGWLWGSSSSSSSSSSPPQDTLDPSLRDFLEKEAPTGPKPALPSRPVERPVEKAAARADAQSTPPEAPAKEAVPPESQFQDGRYAHLWKGYQPQHQLEEQGKSEQDRLRDIVDAYNDRKADIGRIAMENCALEYLQQFECFRKPSWTQASTMCRTESRVFNRCYDVQSKFLKALGYMTMDARSPEESEKIQMHADKLYQEMLEQEKLIDKAKEEGKPIPKFESVLSKQNVVRAVSGKAPAAPSALGQIIRDDEEEQVWKNIKPESRKSYEQKLAGLRPEDREFERKALLGELKAQTGMVKAVEEAFIEERINRMKRRETGQSTIGDTIKRLWGWD
ncbi:hypothetical protein P280DRAFT_467279 [Massarina eburnea CBS 473.64]|uniref:Autophagy protein n=1 Tax=Massarina eburnea CBS 473.64 TaxID=1395130 RepID=A0A6A6S8Z6_9PLEO|nr:hypothetical protein P280DRAFT_467279 [Massarina eburnea CBS 473.64]